MTNVLSAATSAVTAALSSLPSNEEIDIGASMQLIGAMDQLRAALEPPSLTIINLCISVRLSWDAPCLSRVEWKPENISTSTTA
jgi:hypothetical protein